MKTKKVLLILLSVFLVVGCFSGCAPSEKTGTTGETRLKWMLPGDHFSEKDEAEVYAMYNQKLNEYLPGVQVDLDVVSFADYAQRLQLSVSAQEKLDIVWSGYVIPYTSEANNGTFLALDDLLEEHGKDMLTEIPDWAWEQQKVNGKIYSVPNMQQVVNEGKSLYYQHDQGEEYMNKEELISILNTGDVLTREAWDAIGEYLEKLKQNGEIKKGISTSSLPKQLGVTRTDNIVDNFVILHGEDEIKVQHLFETPDLKIAFDVMADWYKKGYIVEDVASLESASQYEFKEDGNVLWAHNYFKDCEVGYQKKESSKFVDVVPIKRKPFIKMSPAATSTSITSYSKHPVEAMKVLDLMNTKKGAELFNLLAFGIEGKQYNLVDGRVSAVRDATGNPLYWLNRWVVGNIFNGYEQVSDPEGWYDYLLELQGPDVDVSPLLGFKPDISQLSTELSHIRAIEGEYYRSLCDGALPDHNATYNEMMDKLRVAGLDEVKAELQSQIDAWLAANK